MLLTICSWCQMEGRITVKGVEFTPEYEGRNRTSHGICEACFNTVLSEAREGKR